MAIFASREQLCIKEELDKLKGKEKIEACSRGIKLSKKLKKDPVLLNKFNSVYGTKNITGDMIANSIAEFEKSLITPNSRFDKYLRGDKKAITADEKAGYELFQKQDCTSCHFGPALGGSVFRKMGIANDYFADRVQGRNGLTKRALSEADLGLYNFTKKDLDKIKSPVLIIHSKGDETTDYTGSEYLYRNIGSTNKTLDERLRTHKYNYKYFTIIDRCNNRLLR